MIAQLISFLYLLAWKIVRTVPEASAYRFFRYMANRAVRRQSKSFEKKSKFAQSKTRIERARAK